MSSSSHRYAMVSALERYLIKNWLVNVTGRTRPGSKKLRGVKGRIPDLEGVTSFLAQPVYGAAEECDTYAMKEVRMKLDAFSRVPNAAVFLVVPAECYEQARAYFQSALPGRNLTVLPYGRA